MIQLDEHSYLYLLGILPLFVLLQLALTIWKKKAQKRFALPSRLKVLAPEVSTSKASLKLIIQLLAFSSLILALVNPKAGTRMETVKREGVDIVFAVDVSKSMLVEDMAPNRLEKAKRIVSEIINQLASDRIGIIAYAATAYPQLPITTDFGAAKMFLQSLNTDMLSSQGTELGEAIKLATTYYNDEAQTNRILFIISDGEDHSENGVESVIEDALDQGIKIFTIGVGTSKGGPIPIKERGIVQELKKDENGEVVISKLRAELLQEIADLGKGTYLYGQQTDATVASIKESLDQLDKTEFETKQFSDYKDQFQWFIAFALLLFFVDIFILDRKTHWFTRLNLFKEHEDEQ
jgi:Ca-activated chloride channel family protein